MILPHAILDLRLEVLIANWLVRRLRHWGGGLGSIVSLSPITPGCMPSSPRLGDADMALRYLRETAATDLDLDPNSAGGVRMRWTCVSRVPRGNWWGRPVSDVGVAHSRRSGRVRASVRV
jgi:hypothetical protein